MKKILILGAGTAGTIMANRLAKLSSKVKEEIQLTIVDPDPVHVYQPGLLFVPFGSYSVSDIIKPKSRLISRKVRYIESEVESVLPDTKCVSLKNGSKEYYDILIVATGVKLLPEETEGLTGPGWKENRFDFYTVDGASALHNALDRFTGGRLVINITDMPIKCPVAPLEFAFLADSYFTRRKIRDRVDISFVTPLDGAFTKPKASAVLGGLLKEKNINVIPEYNTGRVEDGKIISWDEREVPFDLLVTIPLHGGADFVKDSGLGDDLGFVKTNPNTLQHPQRPEVFALGDAANVPTSKAGSVVHFESEILAENILLYLEGKELKQDFDGHSNCFIETGFGKASLIDFNYTTEPLPGVYPWKGIGPMKLLKETRLNHMGKLFFKALYWHMLLPGRDLPVSTQMSMTGKIAS